MQEIGGLVLIVLSIMFPTLGFVLLAIVIIYIFFFKKEMEKEYKDDSEQEKEFITTIEQNNISEVKKSILTKYQTKVNIDQDITEDLMKKYKESIK